MVVNKNVAAGQLDELVFLTLTVQVAELPALMLPFDWEMETKGFASVQPETVKVAVPVPTIPGEVALVPETLTGNVPEEVPACSVSVTEPLAPDAIEVSEVFEKVPLKPCG